ncbi:hypothetical protein Q3G72_022455 [Acer saccharum]|nr:hypothetical protein Q3G72_022455 [Acer saccharum]
MDVIFDLGVRRSSKEPLGPSPRCAPNVKEAIEGVIGTIAAVEIGQPGGVDVMPRPAPPRRGDTGTTTI